MESSSSNSEEMELQQMQLDERELHQKCLEWFKKLKIHLGNLHSSFNITNTRTFEIAFCIFFREEYQTFREKMYQNLNKLQWQLERDNFHGHASKTCLVILRTQFKKFFDSREVNASDVPNKSWQESFNDESEVQAIKEIEKWLKESELQQQESLVTEGTTLEANLSTDGTALDASASFCLVNEGMALNDNTGVIESSGTESENSTSENADIGPSYDSDTVTEVPHSNNDTFENVFAHGIQNHEQLESIPDTYVVNENNSNIIFDIPNMDPDRDKEEHDYVAYEQQRAFFASLINNLKCDVEKYNEVNREAHQANALLTNELERYKGKEFFFVKDMTNESEYCKNIKLLNDKISNLKSQACEKDKTFAKENEKYDELRKAGQIDQTLRILLPKEDNVNTGKHGLGFNNQNDNVNPSVLNKAKELAPCLYNIAEMGNDELSDHKIISEEELKCEAKKRLKVKQRKSPLSYHGFVYAETQFEEPPKSYEQNINTRVRNRLSDEFEPLVKNVNLQLNCFEKSLVKEMKDDLKYVMSRKDEFDETCLILDIQQEFFKTQFESVKSVSYSHAYENEMFEQNFALEKENRCLKMTISQIQKYFSKMEAQSIAFEIIESIKKKKFESQISNDFLQESLYDSDPSNVESESGEKKIIFGNETSSFETKIKELEMILAQQTNEFEDAKVDFSMKTNKFETYFEKLENTKVVLERQLDHKIQDSNAEKDQFLKQIASLESKASQDLILNQKEYSELRTSYNALKAKFDALNRDKGKSPISNFLTPKASVSKKIYTSESSTSFQKKVSQFTTYSLQKDRKFYKKPQVFETLTSQKAFKSVDSSKKKHVFETPKSRSTPIRQVWRPKQSHSKPFKYSKS
ncbi:hypothetical protein Tco_0935692 [Tanacetum coccineum]